MSEGETRGRAPLIGWILTVGWIVLGLAPHILPAGKAAAAALGGVQTLLLLIFLGVHGRANYGWKGLGAFVGITALVAFLWEALSIAHGFPFGFYSHSDAFGPKLLGVPGPVVLGYVFLGYPAWVVAKVLTRNAPAPRGLADTVLTPIVAALVLTGYDFAYDPIGATVLHLWAFRDPGGYLGVPLSNFVGWFITGWTFFQLFALVERRLTHVRPASRGFWLQPCLIWGLAFLPYVFRLAEAPEGLAQAGDRVFQVRDVYAAGLLAAVLTSTTVALAAIARIAGGFGKPDAS